MSLIALLGLTWSLFSTATFAQEPPSDLTKAATQAGFSTQPIEVEKLAKAINKKPEQYLNAFGVNDFKALTNGVSENINLYKNGMGDITTPAQITVDACQNKTDPTCRAIQLLTYQRDHHPEPEPQDIRAVADFENMKANLPIGTAPDNVPCQPIVADFKPIQTKKTCRPGTLLERTECFKGIEPDGTVLVNKIRIDAPKPIEVIKTCEPQKTEVKETKNTVSCKEPLEVIQTETQTTDAEITYRDYWTYSCKPRAHTTKRVTCSRYLVKSDDQSTCPNGTVRINTHTSDALVTDDVPEFDTLTATYVCGKDVTLSINGASTKWTRGEGTSSRLIRDRKNRQMGYRYTVKRKNCEGTHCVLRYEAEIYRKGYLTDTIKGVMIIEGEGLPPKPPVWVDNCKALTSEDAK